MTGFADPFSIFEAPASLLDAYIDLVEEAADWLWARGVHQWRPGEHRNARTTLVDRIENGCLILAEIDSHLAGGCILSSQAPDCWPDAPDDAMYLGELVVARFAAGRDLGERILEEAIQAVHRRGKASLRLDCWDGNEFLKAYYREQGFQDMGRVRENDYWVRLFEQMWDEMKP